MHLGFEVRVELVLGDGEEIAVQLTRDEADELELGDGDIVHVRSTALPPRMPSRSRRAQRVIQASGSRA